MKRFGRLQLSRLTVLALAAPILLVVSLSAALQEVNDTVRLKSFSDLGVPLHPEPGAVRVSDRLPGGTIAKVVAKDQATGWLKITAGDKSGWIIKRYVDAVIATPDKPAEDELSFVIGCWNLEHFHDGAKRGFPENTNGGPTHPPRTPEDFQTIAAIIESLEVKVLVLEEIFAEEDENSNDNFRSKELDRLIDILGRQNYGYVVAESGNTQHIAILFDHRHIRLNGVTETDFRKKKVDGKNLFDRQPLLAHCTFLRAGKKMNDLTVVGVHLAAGQHLFKNHDQAMDQLLKEIDGLRKEEGSAVPKNERDIAILGDFNANRFDDFEEKFWDKMESNGWDVLANEDKTYPATRLSGFPLQLRQSKIDYIIITKGNGGLSGEEVKQAQATVHTELVKSSPDDFRKSASDHLPVTIKVRVIEDND